MRVVSIVSFIVLVMLSGKVGAKGLDHIFGPVEIASRNISVFSTPIATQKNKIFITHVESTDIKGICNLETVIYEGTVKDQISWKRKVIDDKTVDDPWHTQSSIAIDKQGYVHIAYNMHHIPWQYSVSRRPLDTSEFVFRGQSITKEEVCERARTNKTPFMSYGSASIQGNQITYPMFFLDRNNDLYITYRFALHPAKKWLSRQYAGGISKYDTVSKTWISVGAGYPISEKSVSDYSSDKEYTVFATNEGYAVYLVNLAFDNINNMHCSWMWRKSDPGPLTQKPSYAKIIDLDHFKFKTLQNTEFITNSSKEKYYPQTSIAIDSKNRPYVLLQDKKNRTIYVKERNRWKVHSESPHGAYIIHINETGFYAFASGPKVFKYDQKNNKWHKLQESSGYYNIRYCYDKESQMFYLYGTNKQKTKASVFTFKDD